MGVISSARLIGRTIIASAIIVASFASVTAQEAQVAGQPIRKKYSIKVDFPQNVASSYAMTEKTIVKRDYRDDQHKNYEREVSYYFTMGTIGETEDGLTKLLCNIDSLKYSFKEGNVALQYDSQNPRASNIKGDFADLTYTQAPLNHMFVLLLDKKNIVKGITGNGESGDVEWLRNFILVEGAESMDTAQKFLWLDGISLNRLQTLVDMNGGLIRERMLIADDSSWSQPSLIRLDCIEFTDTLTAKVTAVSRGVYSIESTVSGLKANVNREHRMFGIPGPGTVLSTEYGSGKTKLKVNQKGSIRGYDADFTAKLNCRYGNEKFVQTITTSIRCSILNQFGW
ncbi:hypothetical protein MASR2M18_16570 [Ignavibacteria bacterium]